MKLLLLLSLIALVAGGETLIIDRAEEANDVSAQAISTLQAQPNGQEVIGERRLGKRSYGLLPSTYVGTYTSVLPWYRFGGLSSYGLYDGWYPSWPLLYRGW